jgi:16S rRNA U516 pseudouridylate synthase RsuA-like enzyme
MADADYPLRLDGTGRIEVEMAQALGLSRRVCVEWLRAGRVRHRSGRFLRKGERLTGAAAVSLRLAGPLGTWVLPAPEVESALAMGDGWLALDKRCGEPCHLLMPHGQDTALNRFVALNYGAADAGDDPLQGGLVHRLDNDASGVLICATGPDSFQELRSTFASSQIERLYVVRTAADSSGQFIGAGSSREPLSSRGPRVVIDRAGRAAHTEWLVLDDRGLLEVRLYSGHRHQIRVHLAAAGFPVVGDVLYGGAPAERLMLHCERLAWPGAEVVAKTPQFP